MTMPNYKRDYKIYVFDLDSTICRPQKFDDTERRYGQAAPIPEMITFMQALKASGGYIIINTARRMLTHKGDLAKIEADVGQVTRDWLAEHKVPYDELLFGKPYGDYYIDDKAVNADELLEDLRYNP
jgi:capsule biosynthesis phosphatase